MKNTPINLVVWVVCTKIDLAPSKSIFFQRKKARDFLRDNPTNDVGLCQHIERCRLRQVSL